MRFDDAKLAITKDANQKLQVLHTTVCWRGPQSFSTYPANPTSDVPLPPEQVFVTDDSVPHPSDPTKRIAILRFKGTIEPLWHSHYSNRRQITQLMNVNGALKELKIQLSCDHSHVAPQLQAFVHAVGGAVLAVIQGIHLLFRRLFGTTKRLAR